MAKRIEASRPPSRRGAQEIRSQLALELGLNAYAVIGALVMLRCLLLTLSVGDRLWIGRVIYRATRLLVLPLTVLPGANRTVLGSLTLADATLLAAVILVPIGILALGKANRG